MSIEALVLLAVFILLPLLQRLLAGARQRGGRAPQGTGRQPPPDARAGGAPQPPARAPLPPTLADPPRPKTAPHPASGATAPDAAEPVTRAVMPRRKSRRRTAAAGLRNRFDLRRAMVLVSILGPCRAINPYDSPERAGRQ